MTTAPPENDATRATRLKRELPPLAGFLKGIRVDDEDIQEAKRALFNRAR